MGAGKSTVGARVAEQTARPFVDLDRLIERRHGPIPELFERGEPEFRRIEEGILAETLAGPDAVIALGGGTVLSPLNRERLRARAFTVFLDVDVETAWKRVGGSDRPLARREDDFRKLYASRQEVYAEAADGVAHDADGVLLAALAVEQGGRIAPSGPVEVVADERVLELHAPPVDGALHRLPAGEAAKTLAVVERLLGELALGRDGTIVAFGGGATTDVAGFVAVRVPARAPVDRGADDADGPGGRRHRGQDRDQHRGRQEPRRRLPLSAARCRRSQTCWPRCRSRSDARAWPRS